MISLSGPRMDLNHLCIPWAMRKSTLHNIYSMLMYFTAPDTVITATTCLVGKATACRRPWMPDAILISVHKHLHSLLQTPSSVRRSLRSTSLLMGVSNSCSTSNLSCSNVIKQGSPHFLGMFPSHTREPRKDFVKPERATRNRKELCER